MIHWKLIAEYIEPNWEKLGTDLPPVLFWRSAKGSATLGYIRDEELFDYKWVYVCDFEQGHAFLRGECTR